MIFIILRSLNNNAMENGKQRKYTAFYICYTLPNFLDIIIRKPFCKYVNLKHALQCQLISTCILIIFG